MWALAVLLAAAIPARASSTDEAMCAGLSRSGDRLRLALRPDSDFPDQVGAAFEGQGSGDATAGDYLTRGRELHQLVAAVDAQCRAAFGFRASPTSAPEAAAIRRRAQSAQRTAELYLALPRLMAELDAEGNPADQGLRPQFLRAMYKIADGPDYAAAQVLADAASAQRQRARR